MLLFVLHFAHRLKRFSHIYLIKILAEDLSKFSMFKNDSLNFRAVLYAAAMVLLMWIGFFVQNLGLIQGCNGAIIPLVPEGLKGIVFSPFLHGGLEHILGNSVPMFVLVFLLFQFYPWVAKKVFFLGWFLGGFLVWLLPAASLRMVLRLPSWRKTIVWVAERGNLKQMALFSIWGHPGIGCPMSLKTFSHFLAKRFPITIIWFD